MLIGWGCFFIWPNFFAGLRVAFFSEHLFIYSCIYKSCILVLNIYLYRIAIDSFKLSGIIYSWPYNTRNLWLAFMSGFCFLHKCYLDNEHLKALHLKSICKIAILPLMSIEFLFCYLYFLKLLRNDGVIANNSFLNGSYWLAFIIRKWKTTFPTWTPSVVFITYCCVVGG